MKTLTTTISLIILMAVFAVSCSRDTTEDAKALKRGLSVLAQSAIDPNEVFALSRNGEKVTIQLHVDFSDCASVQVLRNTTGIAKNRDTVAVLDVKARSHQDIVPDTEAFTTETRFRHGKSSMPSQGK